MEIFVEELETISSRECRNVIVVRVEARLDASFSDCGFGLTVLAVVVVEMQGEISHECVSHLQVVLSRLFGCYASASTPSKGLRMCVAIAVLLQFCCGYPSAISPIRCERASRVIVCSPAMQVKLQILGTKLSYLFLNAFVISPPSTLENLCLYHTNYNNLFPSSPDVPFKA